jgi:hypothetical protein
VYRRTVDATIHRGAVYQYRPISWLVSPVLITRDIQWNAGIGTADVHPEGTLGDEFRRQTERHEEDIIVRAKVRFLVILSSNFECQDPRFLSVLVAPTFTISTTRHQPNFIEKLRTGRSREHFYLPLDPAFPRTTESYIDFRHTQMYNKRILGSNKASYYLTESATKAVLFRFQQYAQHVAQRV